MPPYLSIKNADMGIGASTVLLCLSAMSQYFAQYFSKTGANTKKAKSPKTIAVQGFSMELMAGFEPATSSLPTLREGVRMVSFCANFTTLRPSFPCNLFK